MARVSLSSQLHFTFESNILYRTNLPWMMWSSAHLAGQQLQAGCRHAGTQQVSGSLKRTGIQGRACMHSIKVDPNDVVPVQVMMHNSCWKLNA